MLEQILENVLSKANIDYENTGSRIYFSCPFHSSLSADSLSVLLEGNTQDGVWRCWSQNCQEKIGYGIENLIRGLCKLYSIDIDIPRDDKNTSFIQYNRIASTTKYEEKYLLGVNDIKKSLSKDKHFSSLFLEETLIKYNVGYCNNKQKRLMFNRSVVPILNDDGTFMVGCMGRSNYPQCPLCTKFHSGECPTNKYDKFLSSKWLNSAGFDARYYLYNWWFAKQSIIEKGAVLLVEGPSDVWRLYESGIYNVLAIFGTAIKEEQLSKLNSLPIFTLYLGLDNDEAGHKGIEVIKKNYSRFYNLKTITPTKKDWGEMTTSEIGMVCKKLY